ncbi:ABC transporter permease, partial [Planococcus sp. SIMBA_143]
DSEYLLGYNFYSSTTALASGFTAIGSTTEETAEEESGNGGFGGGGFGGNAADVSVQGIVYSDAVDLFMDGEAELTEGRHITEEDAAANVV